MNGNFGQAMEILNPMTAHTDPADGLLRLWQIRATKREDL